MRDHKGMFLGIIQSVTIKWYIISLCFLLVTAQAADLNHSFVNFTLNNPFLGYFVPYCI